MKTSSSQPDAHSGLNDWQVELHPYNPTLVLFRCFAGEALVAEHRSRWRGRAHGWDPQLWVPRTPPVPAAVLKPLEQLLG